MKPILPLCLAVLLATACRSSAPEAGEVVAESPASPAEQTSAGDPADAPGAGTGGGTGAASMDSMANPAPGGPSAAPPGSPMLTPQGWGPLRIGMTRAQVVAAAGEDANPAAVGGPEPERCDEFRPAEAPQGMLVMIENGRLTRISLSAGTDVVTEAGFGVGASADSIAAAYGGCAALSPHKYLAAPGAYITVWEIAPGAGDARGIVYEIGLDGRAMHVHAGSASIQYVEGCL